MAKVKVGKNMHETMEHTDAVFRIQTAQSSKVCHLGDVCVLGGEILPTQKYARVYTEETDLLEFFHYACFEEVHGRGR